MMLSQEKFPRIQKEISKNVDEIVLDVTKKNINLKTDSFDERIYGDMLMFSHLSHLTLWFHFDIRGIK